MKCNLKIIAILTILLIAFTNVVSRKRRSHRSATRAFAQSKAALVAWLDNAGGAPYHLDHYAEFMGRNLNCSFDRTAIRAKINTWDQGWFSSPRLRDMGTLADLEPIQCAYRIYHDYLAWFGQEIGFTQDHLDAWKTAANTFLTDCRALAQGNNGWWNPLSLP